MTLDPCPDDETLARFVERTLDPATAAHVGPHTERCEACRRVISTLMKLRSSRGISLTFASGAAETAPSSLPAVPEGTALGRYVTRRFVGSGAMGIVLEGWDPSLQRKVALKLLKGAATEAVQARLAKEAQVMARVSHRNVATVFDVGTFEGRNWVAMEFIDGVTLRGWLQSKPASSQILDVLLAAGTGLAAAHQQGLVHRDFKPDNVLVERSGRVVVTDFGLSADLHTSSLEPSADLVGTPAYMPLEQLQGHADARSDQFAFCVTCVEALTGQRPFDVTTLKELPERLAQPPDSQVMNRLPARARRVLEQGLSPDPKARFASMQALLDALRPPRQERLIAAAMAVTALLVLGALGYASWRSAHVCSGAPAQLAGVWDEAVKARTLAAIAATKLPFADAAAQGLSVGLDAWAARWQASWVDACEDTHVRHEQSDELFDLRMTCLRERLDEVRALQATLANPDEKLLRSTSRLTEQLSPLSLCSDEAVLKAPLKLPASPEKATQVIAGRQTLHQLIAMRALGQFTVAREQARALALTAAELKYRPFEAEVLVLLGQLDEDVDDNATAVTNLERAAIAAEAGGHVFLAGQAWAFLTRIQGFKLNRPEDGKRAHALAEAVVERLNGNSALLAVLHRSWAEVLSGRGDHAGARAEIEQALALQKQWGSENVEVAATLNSLGNELRSVGDFKGSRELYQSSLDLLTRLLGPKHPDLAQVQRNLGTLSLRAGNLDEAQAWYAKALALQVAAFGPDNLQVADTRNALAAVAIRQGHMPEAETELRAVIAVREKQLGTDNEGLFAQLNNLAIALRNQGKTDEAQQVLERALAIAEKAHGPEHEDVATTLVNLGDVQLARRDFVGSAKTYERAITVTEKVSGPDHANLADCWGGLAFPLIQLGQWRRALEATEKAQAIYAKTEGDAMAVALVHFAHAQALWQTVPARRGDAMREAKVGRAGLEKAGATPDDLKEVDTWLSLRKE